MRQVYGQRQAKNLIARSLGADRLAHAYLFQGPGGIGKQLFARGLAAVINCAAAQGIEACGVCGSCTKMAAGSHPDFLLVSPEKGAIKIDQVRRLIKELSFDPYEGNSRVVVIEDVHTMRQEAANALLKTLEEPPPNNLLVLTADSSGNVLQTILSRCQTIPFYPLTKEDTVAVLLQQDEGIDEETALLLARFSEGSPGKALLLHQKQLTQLLQEVVGLLGDEQSKLDSETGKVLQVAENMSSLKEDLPHFLSLLRLWLRDGLMAFHGEGGAVAESEARTDSLSC